MPEQDTLVYTQDEPDIAAIIKEYEQCSPISWGWNKLRDNEDTRFNIWDNQNSDGKKHHTSNADAFPWDGASDSQVFLSDAIINENVAIKVNAWERSIVVARGVEPNDYESAAYITKLLEWLTGTKLKSELAVAANLAAQYEDTYGVYVLHPTWEREVRLKTDRVTLQQMAEMAAQNPEGPLGMLTQLIANEDTEEQAVALVQEYGRHIAQSVAATQLNGEESDLFNNYKVKAKTARRFVRELREGKSSTLPIPYICKNQPCIETLKLWEEVFIPSYVEDIQKSPYVFVKRWFTEQELRSKAALEDWDEDWVERAVKEKGRESTWSASRDTTTIKSISQMGGENTFTWLNADQTQNSQIEVIYAYTQELDDDDVTSIYYTICHANITKAEDGNSALYAKRDKLDYKHQQMPFIPGMRERWNKAITSSRGVPQMLASRQREVKVQRDSLVDSTSISVLPPINIYASGPQGNYKFGPAVRNTVLPGREPKAMEIPVHESSAFKLMESFDKEVKEEMGIMSPDIPVARVQVKQQRMVNNFLGPWTEGFQQMFALCEQYMPDQMFMEITGSPKPMPKGEMITLQKDFILTFDVRQMDMEHIQKQADVIAKTVLPFDREGVISFSKLVRVLLRGIDPALAREITLDGNSASQQLVQRVEADFVSMFTGNEPRLTPNDNPTAQAEIQSAQQILEGNRKYQQALQTDMDFKEKVEKWFENRTFNIQQDQNKQTGRMGVAA